ncbi:MAG: response regulator [Acidobacteria bacterium]|nr:response regulator [Acidobacteriota bacterium]
MRRPSIIVAEPEPEQALSTRKLVLETSKFNVLTAHSTEEAIELFQAFPNASAVVVVDSKSIDCVRVLNFVRTVTNSTPLIALSARLADNCAAADHHLSSHDPEALINLLRSMLGDPRNLDTPSEAAE